MLNKLVLRLLKAEMRRRHSAAKKRAIDNGVDPDPAVDLAEAQRFSIWYRRDMVPNVVIGSEENPYLYRWFVIPRNKWFNIYFHHFLRSDDDRALHDHPWWNMSWLLEGDYDEVVFVNQPRDVRDGWEYEVPETTTIRRKQGHFAFRGARTAHRVQLLRKPPPLIGRTGRQITKGGDEQPVWTLFITGPKIRGWGFWCPKAWRHWENFVHFPKGDASNGVSQVGQGCD